MNRLFTKLDWKILLGLTLAALLLRFINLSHPSGIVFDETYFANFAHNYLTGTKFFDAEPPTGKFIIAFGEYLFGFNAFGWRVMPALFGAAVIPLMYVLVKRLFGGVVMPTIAASLALFDGLLLVESRTALLDIFVVFFNLLTYLLFIVSLQAKTAKRSLTLLVLTGVSLGLGLSVKWITLAFLGPAIALLVVLKGREWSLFKKLFRSRGQPNVLAALDVKPANLHRVPVYLMFLGLLPAAVYVLLFQLHVPFDSTGESLIGIHKQIFNYHHTLTATHPYGSAWYTWPFMIRPVAYHFQQTTASWEGIVALGNPVIWWSGVVALAYAAYRLFKTRSIALFIILLAFLAHFGPWALISRVLFIYHYLGGLPFTIIALAYGLTRSWHARPKDTSMQIAAWLILFAVGAMLGYALLLSLFPKVPPAGHAVLLAANYVAPFAWWVVTGRPAWRWGRKLTVAFMAITALAFVYFYPVWTGIGLSPEDYYRHMWLRSWI